MLSSIPPLQDDEEDISCDIEWLFTNIWYKKQYLYKMTRKIYHVILSGYLQIFGTRNNQLYH